jgi:hypothetical protein
MPFKINMHVQQKRITGNTLERKHKWKNEKSNDTYSKQNL